MFAIAERLHITVTTVERMSVREVQAWVDYWQPGKMENNDNDGAIDLATLSPQALRSMFPGR